MTHLQSETLNSKKFKIGDKVSYHLSSEMTHPYPFTGEATILSNHGNDIWNTGYQLKFDKGEEAAGAKQGHPYWDDDLILCSYKNNTEAKQLLIKR